MAAANVRRWDMGSPKPDWAIWCETSAGAHPLHCRHGPAATQPDDAARAAAGGGTARAQRLRALELVTVRDALVHFPRDYKDFSGAHAFADLVEGEHASVAGTVADVRQRTTAHGRSMLTVLVEGQGGSVRGVWFNMPFMAKKFAVGATVVFAGVPKRAGTTWEMSHPEVRLCAAGEEPIRGEYLPVYPGAEGVRQSDVRLAVQAALAHAGDILEEAFPEEWLAAKGLMPIREAMHEIHAPASLEKNQTGREPERPRTPTARR